MNGGLIKLDIGCGCFKKQGFIGLDRRFDTDADIFGSALALPIRSGSVSEVSGSNLIEHFYGRDAQVVFNEVYRVLEPGGVARFKVGYDFSKARLLRADSEHKERFSERDLYSMVSKFSFGRVKTKLYNFGLHFRIKTMVELMK